MVHTNFRRYVLSMCMFAHSMNIYTQKMLTISVYSSFEYWNKYLTSFNGNFQTHIYTQTYVYICHIYGIIDYNRNSFYVQYRYICNAQAQEILLWLRNTKLVIPSHIKPSIAILLFEINDYLFQMPIWQSRSYYNSIKRKIELIFYFTVNMYFSVL